MQECMYKYAHSTQAGSLQPGSINRAADVVAEMLGLQIDGPQQQLAALLYVT